MTTPFYYAPRSSPGRIYAPNVSSNPDTQPSYNAATQTLILNDAMQHASFPAAVTAGWDGVHRDGSLGDHVIYDGTMQDLSFCATGANLAGVADSPTGSGTCMGVEFTGFNTDGPVDQPQEARTWHRRFSDVLLGKPGHAMYLSFYHKFVAGAGHTLDGLVESGGSSPDICKVKWLELWPNVGTGGSRAQFNTSSSTNVNDVPNTGCGGTGTLWAADGNGTGGGAGPTAHCGQVRAPFAYQARSSWHKTTYKYMTQTAPGARDGVMQMWYDGTLIVANAAPYLNVTVPGGLGTDFFNGGVPQKWCLTGDIDNIFTDDYIISLTLAGVSTSGFWPYKILYGGPFMVWRD